MRRHRRSVGASCRCPRGFTLIEVMVALLVSAVVILGARLMFEQLTAQAERIVGAAGATDRNANAERQMRALARRLEIGTQSSAEFGGDKDRAHFSSWCDVAAGWQERCRVEIAVQAEGESRWLIVKSSTGDSLIVRDHIGPCELRYLGDAGNGGTWFQSWGAGISAPIAIGVITDRDTLILRIGARG